MMKSAVGDPVSGSVLGCNFPERDFWTIVDDKPTCREQSSCPVASQYLARLVGKQMLQV